MKGGGESGEPPRTDEPPGSLSKDEQDMVDLKRRLKRMSLKEEIFPQDNEENTRVFIFFPLPSSSV